MKNLDVILAVIGGAVAGAAIGLLFAPKKGDDLREEIMEYLKAQGMKLRRDKLEKLVEDLESEIKK